MGELAERGLCLLGMAAQEVVEHLLPGNAVSGGGVGDDPVEVKDNGVKVVVGHSFFHRETIIYSMIAASACLSLFHSFGSDDGIIGEFDY